MIVLKSILPPSTPSAVLHRVVNSAGDWSRAAGYGFSLVPSHFPNT
ncbi:hypothetical protein PMAG_b0137 [Pseudoalteromonas mariniglutinosa NCIMB 1770]|nr:hypothetical protein [Pseudoalteromonas mariniglutinosa NCIMB 1770]